MQFYVSWYHGDPLYQRYDEHCCMLVSPTSVSSDWTLDSLPQLPSRVMFDSGGYRYMAAHSELPPAKDVFERQLRMFGKADIPATLCALDFPMAERGLTPKEWDRRLTHTLSNAYEFRRLIGLHGLDSDVEFMAVVQGYDVDSLVACARELSVMGFSSFGIGSLVSLRDLREVVRRVESVASIVGKGIHVFGVSSIRAIRVLRRLGVASIDSSRPVKSAAYNEILYSRPFRRYGILAADGAPTAKMPKEQCLAQPLPCSCPICQENAMDIMQVGDRRFTAKRAIHNYLHLKASIG